MSEGLWPAIIGGIATVLAALIAALMNRRANNGEKKPSRIDSPATVRTQAPPNQEKNERIPPSTSKDRIRPTKYQALHDHLLAQEHLPSVRLTFAEIASLLGEPLPKSALKYRAWWGNQSDTTNRSQAAAWMEAGFEVSEVHQDQAGGWVAFRRRG